MASSTSWTCKRLGRYLKVTCAWTSHTDGTVGTANTCPFGVHGLLWWFLTDPSATAPTDDYDLQLQDAHGVDLLNGQGADRDTANSEAGVPVWGGAPFPSPVDGTIKLVVSAAGDTKQGTWIGWFEVLDQLQTTTEAVAGT